MNWHDYYLGLLEAVAAKSKDPSTKVGAIIVGPDNEVRSTGFNGFPRGVREDISMRWERPWKYLWVAHAEDNAIANAARAGTSTNGCRLYVPFAPCSECTKAIIGAGIVEVIYTDEYKGSNPKKWADDQMIASAMAAEARVVLRKYEVDADVKEDLTEEECEAAGIPNANAAMRRMIAEDLVARAGSPDPAIEDLVGEDFDPNEVAAGDDDNREPEHDRPDHHETDDAAVREMKEIARRALKQHVGFDSGDEAAMVDDLMAAGDVAAATRKVIYEDIVRSRAADMGLDEKAEAIKKLVREEGPIVYGDMPGQTERRSLGGRVAQAVRDGEVELFIDPALGPGVERAFNKDGTLTDAGLSMAQAAAEVEDGSDVMEEQEVDRQTLAEDDAKEASGGEPSYAEMRKELATIYGGHEVAGWSDAGVRSRWVLGASAKDYKTRDLQ